MSNSTNAKNARSRRLNSDTSFQFPDRDSRASLPQRDEPSLPNLCPFSQNGPKASHPPPKKFFGPTGAQVPLYLLHNLIHSKSFKNSRFPLVSPPSFLPLQTSNDGSKEGKGNIPPSLSTDATYPAHQTISSDRRPRQGLTVTDNGRCGVLASLFGPNLFSSVLVRGMYPTPSQSLKESQEMDATCLRTMRREDDKIGHAEQTEV
jgi:hypothetical protein